MRLGGRGIGLAAALLGAGTIALFWPGVAMFDSVMQYRQAASGTYLDWHPPVMARLWSLFLPLMPGQGPMFALQMALYWLGLGLLAMALHRAGKRRAALATLAVGLWPPFLGWEAAVLKDCQMASALLAATGLVARRRLAGERLAGASLVVVLVLLAYATLVRANAVFATVPLALGLLSPWQWQRWPSRLVLIGAATLAVLAVAPRINHGLLGARPSGIEASQPIFDLAAIAHRAGPEAVPLLPPATWRAVEARYCATPILWDPLARDQRCGFVQDGLVGRPENALFVAWGQAIREHPGAYAAHRLAHWNATMRWFVPWHFPLTVPQSGSESNDQGLASPGAAMEALAGPAGWLAQSPLGAPILAFAIALAALVLARPGRSAAHALAVALALSTVAMEASFLIVSISSDWRYHLWSMLAAALAAILLATEPLPRRAARIAIAAVMLVAATCLGARLLLSPVGDGYQAALDSGQPSAR